MDTLAIYMVSAAGLKVLWSLINKNCSTGVPKHAELVGQISQINLYPFKSMRVVRLDRAECTYRGLKYPKRNIFDRSFIVIDENGRFVTARGDNKMATIACSVGDREFTLTCDGMPTLTIPISAPADPTKTATTRVWGEKVEGQDCGDDAANWISTCLEKPGCRLLYGREGLQKRELVQQEEGWKQLAKQGDQVTYQDGFPYMLISQASLADFNAVKGGDSFVMDRFRPNLVVSGCKPYDEDTWSEMWIGEKVKFSNLKPCIRCIMTTVDPTTGKKHPNEEPLNTLRKYRSNKALFGRAPMFGVNLVLDRTTGQEIAVGDPVYILRRGSNF